MIDQVRDIDFVSTGDMGSLRRFGQDFILNCGQDTRVLILPVRAIQGRVRGSASLPVLHPSCKTASGNKGLCFGTGTLCTRNGGLAESILEHVSCPPWTCGAVHATHRPRDLERVAVPRILRLQDKPAGGDAAKVRQKNPRRPASICAGRD